MFAGTSHPYMLQVAALWISFIPAFAIVLLLAGAQFERLRFPMKNRLSGKGTAHMR
jgi:hypothetical protein